MDRRSFLQVATSFAGLSTVTGGTLASDSRLSEHSSFEPLGSVAIEGAREAVVHHDNEVSYVAVDDGFAAVDITEPSEPTVLAQRRGIESNSGDPLQQIFDLRARGNRLVVAGPANGPALDGSGFALFDITDPEQPQRVAFFETGYAIHNCYFENETVYLTGSQSIDGAVVMVDVSDDSPREINRWSITDADSANESIPAVIRPLHDISVQDGVAYLSYWDAGTWIVDVTDPSNPTVLSRVGEYDLSELRGFSSRSQFVESATTPGNAHYAQVNDDGTVLAVGKEAWTVEGLDGLTGGAGGVDLYDVSEKTDPSHLAHIEPPSSYSQRRNGWFTTAHNLDMTGDRLYTSWYSGGVKIHDISDPENPSAIAWWRKPSEASFWTARSAGDVFVASSLDAGVIAGTFPSETREALYVFPDTAGRQEEPPSLEEPPEGVTRGNDGEGGSDSTADDSEQSEMDDTTDDSEQTDGNTTEDTADDGGPGFGAGAALAGLGGASYLLARRRGSDEDEQF